MRLQSLLGRSSSVAALMLAASLPLVGQAQETTSTDEEATLERVFVEGRRVSQTDEAIGLNEASNTVAVTREELLCTGRHFGSENAGIAAWLQRPDRWCAGSL